MGASEVKYVIDCLGDIIMQWGEAHERIKESINTGIHLGNNINCDIQVTGLNYNGFTVHIDGSQSFNLKWFILERCWKAMNEKRVYTKDVFVELFGDCCLGNPDCVEIVGQVFIKAGLARLHENIYHNFKGKLFKQLKLKFDTRILSHA